MKKISLIYLPALVLVLLSAVSNSTYATPAVAGNCKVSGRIVASDTKEGLFSANVGLYHVGDSAFVLGMKTKKDGSFEIVRVPMGEFFLKITYVGYAPKFVDSIKLDETRMEYSCGDIALEVSAAMSKTVTVEALARTIEYQDGKMVVNMNQSLTASGGNATDALKTVPSVQVDIEGNISMRGSQNLKILVNNRPSEFLGHDLKQVLESIPAGSIEKIEVITNPGAKYDAAGTTGIINIITKVERQNGFNSIMSLYGNTADKYNGDITLNYLLDKFNFYGGYNFYMDNYGKGDYFSKQEIYSFIPNTKIIDTTRYLNQNGDYMNQYRYNSGNIGFDYLIGEKASLTGSTYFGGGTNKSRAFSENEGFTNYDQTKRLFSKNSHEDGNNSYFGGGLSFRQEYESREHELSADIYFSGNNWTEDGNSEQLEKNIGVTSLLQKTSTDNKSNSMNMNVNYTHPLPLGCKVETGFWYNSEHSDDSFIRSVYDPNAKNWFTDEASTNHFIFDEQITASFATVSGNISKIHFSAGVRAEYSHRKGEQKATNFTLEKDYFYLYPSANLSWSFTDLLQLQLNYSRRVDRPYKWYLNPRTDFSDSTRVYVGNPDLTPEFANSYEVGLMINLGYLTVTPSFFYRNEIDVISPINEMVGTTRYYKFVNVAKGQNYGGEMSIQANPAMWWMNSIDVSYYRQTMDNPISQTTNDTYSWSARYMGMFNFAFSAFGLDNQMLSAQIMANFMPGSVTPQGKRDDFFMVDLGLRHQFTRSFSMSLRISDIFNNIKWGGESFGENYKLVSNYHHNQRGINIGFTYKLREETDRERRSGNHGGGGMQGGGGAPSGGGI